MQRLEILILYALNNIKSNVQSLTVAEIAAKFEAATHGNGYSTNNVYRKIKRLEKQGYILPGVKDGRAQTYYISPVGKKLVQQMKENEFDGVEK